MRKNTMRLLVVAGVLVVVGLPVVGKWARTTAAKTCAEDGAGIDPLYRARVVDLSGRDREFCCIRCAALWLSHEKLKPRSVWVTDETTGQEIPAASASYVRSMVVTVAHTGNRIHSFREPTDALRHAGAAGGRVLSGRERPFAGPSAVE
jgi:hypothetical protein